MGLRRLEAGDGGVQGRGVRRRRHQGPDLGTEAQDGGPILGTQGRHPLPQGLADALEGGRVEGARQVHQEEVEHPLATGREGRAGHHLRHLGAEGGVEGQGLVRHGRAQGVAHPRIDLDLGALRQGLADAQARRFPGQGAGGQQPGQPEEAEAAGSPGPHDRASAGLSATGQVKWSPQKGTKSNSVSPSSMRS